jgi:hypothetical protein
LSTLLPAAVKVTIFPAIPQAPRDKLLGLELLQIGDQAVKGSPTLDTSAAASIPPSPPSVNAFKIAIMEDDLEK